jgi:chromosome segregation ATPase
LKTGKTAETLKTLILWWRIEMGKNKLVIAKENMLEAETTELQTLKNELTRTDSTPAELQKLAEDKSVEILRKINAATERITEAKESADSAKAMKSGGFFGGKTKAKADATANAVVATNEALAEMNNLIQESIRFTCSSIQFAQVMHKTMAYMMANGFEDTNGQIRQLSNDSKEVVQSILDEADEFVAKQRAVEKKQRAVEEKLAELRRRLDEKDKVDEEQNQRLEKLKSVFEGELEKINKAFTEKDKIDREQSERLENVQKLLAEKNQIDEKQKNVLDKEQNENMQKRIDELKSVIFLKNAILAISIAALAISTGTLVFFIFRL